MLNLFCKKINNITKTTLQHNLCISCGICKVVCNFGAISMKRNKYGEVNPVIDKKKCRNCAECIRYCPNTKNKTLELSKKVCSISKPHTYGLQNAKYYLAWDNNTHQRIKCCSGGVVTKLATHLLQNSTIDGMIHVERIWGHFGDLHYKARLSTSESEIQEHVSSAYQPIDFSDVLFKLKENKTYFITGTPCVIRAIKNLFDKNKKFSSINIITCALICSHNTNSQFIDYLGKINNVDNKNDWKVNIRHKDNSIIDANNFKTRFYTKEKDLLNKNRFESGWTKIWREYFFAMNACLKCSDFWGHEADISVKDAWGEWAKDPLGKSIVVIRNNILNEIFINSGIIFEELDFTIMENHQKPTAIFKQTESFNKNFKHIFSKSNRRNGLFQYYINSKLSKFLYTYLGYKATRIIMPVVTWLGCRSKKL